MNEGDIKKIFVVGAGVMGHGLAQSFAEGGYQVSLYSRTEKTLDRARGLIESSLNTKAKEGLSDSSQIPAILKRITTTTSLEEGAHDADIALETVVENVQAKKDIFAQMDPYCTLVCSATVDSTGGGGQGTGDGHCQSGVDGADIEENG